MTQATTTPQRNCPSVLLKEPVQLGHFEYYQSFHLKIAAVDCRPCVFDGGFYHPVPEGSFLRVGFWGLQFEQ